MSAQALRESRQTRRSTKLLSALLLLTILTPIAAWQRQPDWTWRTGRATHYGGPADNGWSIHEGSCQYYYLKKDMATGCRKDITAVSDHNWDYDGGNGCGVCYEVACNSAIMKDGYGNQLDRRSVCYDESASVIVMVTDTCPCYYPNNAYSNKRWCCGDGGTWHADMSTYAFEKLADKKWGVIGIKYRRVSCDYQPAKRAQVPSGQSPSGPETRFTEPPNWKDRRPSINVKYNQQSIMSAVDAGMNVIKDAAQSISNNIQQSIQSAWDTWILKSGRQSSWADTSFNAAMWDTSSSRGPDGSTSYCSNVAPGGALSFSGWQGAFQDKKQIVMMVKKNDAGIPDFSVVLSGKQGVCREVRIPAVTWITWPKSDWMQVSLPLNAFAWNSPDWSQNVASFKGCGSYGLGAWDLTTIQLKNNRNYNQWLCVDQMRLTV